MKKTLAIILAALFCMSLAACSQSNPRQAASSSPSEVQNSAPASSGSPEASAKPEAKTLSVWGSALVSDSEEKLPQDEWLIVKINKKFEEMNPGVNIEFTLISSASEIPQMFKAAAMSGTAPDLVNLWSGQFVFSLKDILLDISGYIPEKDKTEIQGWDTTTLGFTDGNPVLGYPILGNEICGFVTNKKILSQAGLDFDANPPKTPADLIDQLGKVKALGKTPIVANDDGWGRAYFYTFASWWVQGSGSERVSSDSAGTTKFSDDKPFLESYRLANELYKKGLINTDYLTLPDPLAKFCAGDCAMYACNNKEIGACVEALGKENVGYFTLPDLNSDVKIKNTTIGGPGQCLAVWKDSKNPQLAVDLCSFIMNRDNHLAFLKIGTRLPLRSDISLADLGWDGIEAYEKIYDVSSRYSYWADNSMVTDVCDEMQKYSGLVITGKMSVEEMANKLDQKSAEVG